MPEDVTRDLSAFTPAGLDRDAVLFAAGKAAARRPAVWKWLAVGLAVSNAVTLGVLLWPTPPVEVPVPVEVPPAVEAPPAVVEPVPTRPEPSSYLALTWGLDQSPVADPGTPSPARSLTPRDINDPRIQ
jgi:hypothetical protein